MIPAAQLALALFVLVGMPALYWIDVNRNGRAR